jgi:hypothetical protein
MDACAFTLCPSFTAIILRGKESGSYCVHVGRVTLQSPRAVSPWIRKHMATSRNPGANPAWANLWFSSCILRVHLLVDGTDFGHIWGFVSPDAAAL